MKRSGSDVGPYAMVPLWLLTRVNGTAIQVFALLVAKYIDRQDQAFPSRATLAEGLGVSRRTVDLALKALTGAQALTITRRRLESGSPTSSLYTLWFSRPEIRQGVETTEEIFLSSPQNVPNLQRKTAPDLDPIDLDPMIQRDQDRTVGAKNAPTRWTAPSQPVAKSHPIKAALTLYEEKFHARFGTLPAPVTGKDAKLIQRLLSRFDLAEITRRLDQFFASDDPFIVQTGYTIGVFVTTWNKLGLPEVIPKSRRQRAIEASTRDFLAGCARGDVTGGKV